MVKFSIKQQNLQPNLHALTVMFIQADKQYSPFAHSIDKATSGLVSQVLRKDNFLKKPGNSQQFSFIFESELTSTLIISAEKDLTKADSLDKIIDSAVKNILNSIDDLVEIDLSILFTAFPNKQVIQKLILAFDEKIYQYNTCKTEIKEVKIPSEIILTGVDTLVDAQEQLSCALITAQAIKFAKDLGNAPANLCTPEFLSNQAKEHAIAAGAKATIHDGAAIQALRMGSFWSVAKGSTEAPYFIELSYQGAATKEEAPIVLVGKGITFDSGGISLKPGEGMDEMKYDMCGAATVIATFCAATKMKLPINLVALVPTCENMPSGGANKPGDIVTSMSGQTIEILNTDAEGRLILCDALTYAERFTPKAVIDVATLTGACIIALGHIGSAVIGNNQDLADELLLASQSSHDKLWQLPMWDEYQDQLHSNFADIANIGGRPAGTITAACFLSRFTKKYRWAHLDIAGTAWKSGKEKGATGRPVSLLLEYLKQQATR